MHTPAHFMFAKIESHQSRVERKALVFFPTLNKRLTVSKMILFLPLAAQRIAAPGGTFICHLVLRKRRNEVFQKTAERRFEPSL
jgi:hypothetical protein